MERPIIFFPSSILLILVLIVACGVLALSGADIVNPIHSFLDYQEGMVEVEKEKALKPLQVEIEQRELLEQHQHNQYIREMERQSKAQELEYRQKVQAVQLEHLKRLNAVKEALLELGGKALIYVVSGLLFIALSTRMVVHTVRSVRKEFGPSQHPYIMLTEEEKRACIRAARERERQERLQKIRERELRQSRENDHKQATVLTTMIACHPESSKDSGDYDTLSLAV